MDDLSINLCLKEFQLLARSIGLMWFLGDEEFYLGELLVGDGHQADLSVFGKSGFHSALVDGGIFAAGTMAHVDGELKHGEAVLE